MAQHPRPLRFCMGVGTDLNGHLNCMMPCLVDHLVQREAGTHVRSPGSVHNTCMHTQAQQVVRHYRSLGCRSPSQVGCAPSSAVTPGTFRRWSCFRKRHQPPQQLSRRKLQPQLQMLPPGGCDYHRIPGQASSRISRALLPADSGVPRWKHFPGMAQIAGAGHRASVDLLREAEQCVLNNACNSACWNTVAMHAPMRHATAGLDRAL